jgi:subtilisin family serine protease
MKKLVLVVVLLFCFSLSFNDALFANGKEYDKQTVLVKFKQGVTRAQKHELASLVKGKFKDKNNDGIDDRYHKIAKGRVARFDLNGVGDDPAAVAMAVLKDHPYVDYAQYNYLHYTTVTPDDPRFDEKWGLHNTGQTGGTPDADIDAPEAWETSTGSHSVVVGVIDGGFNYNHEDLAANAWVNPGEIAGNGIDDDGNGYIDDIHGINAISNDGDPHEGNGHGSHCAGIIGAVGNNGTGVVGVNWSVSIMGLRFISNTGSGTTANAIECINYAVDMKTNYGINIRVLSNSWGGAPYEQILYDAIYTTYEADILFVVAAGNNGRNTDSNPFYPACYDIPNIMSVANTNHNDALNSGSNYGLTTVDLAAPGTNILSTYKKNTAYTTMTGTSMAAPFVAGAAALLLSVNNQLTTQDMKDYLMNYVDPIPAMAGKCVSGGRLNIANSLNQLSPPEPSFKLSATPTSQDVEQNQTASFTIDIESILGFSNPVNLSASSDPAINAAITFTPNPGTPGSTSTMDVATTLSTATGYYTITVTGVSGSINKTTSVDLEVTPEGGYPNNPPVANFSTSKNNLKVTFTDTSTDSDGTIVAWNWSFGDGSTSTVQNPVHTYGSSGTYTVTLIVTDDDNATDTISKSVSVTNQNEQ